MTDDQEETIRRATDAALKKLAEDLEFAILYGSPSSLEQPIGIFNCQCATTSVDLPWIYGLNDRLSEAFGDTNPLTPEFRNYD